MCLEDGNMLSGLLVTDQPGVEALEYIAARHSGDDVKIPGMWEEVDFFAEVWRMES